MDLLIVLGALFFLMFAAYKGFSVIIFAPIAAMGAVLLTTPLDVAPVFSGLFMEKMVIFVKNYFPVFLLGAIFGKVIEISGFSKSIVAAVMGWIGQKRAIPVIVIVCMLLTYGGVSLFVVVFAVYPFAAEMFRRGNIPKRLIPGAIALGAFSVTMDALPGTPQIQNIIPTTFFGTTSWAAPWLGIFGSIFVLTCGFMYLEWRRCSAVRNNEGYGTDLVNEPVAVDTANLPSPWLALAPLVLVGVSNFFLTRWIPIWYGEKSVVDLPGLTAPLTTSIKSVTAIWAVEGALILGILFVIITAFSLVKKSFAESTKSAVGGAMLASINTASEYGFGAVIASLSGFLIVRDLLQGIADPLVKAGVSVTSLAGITGSASGGMVIALGAMGDQLLASANAMGIPPEVLHRVVSMASGGMDTLPHNGAVITLLAVAGLTHKQSYKDIFAVTIIKSLAVFFVIGIYYLTGIY
ncbi:MAG: GntP family permease [Enterobacteriaceae bacterium]|jgi:H+/gluconate symporter-like permease|nr:GntP family permease [Enterobacteriaceae bacterium]